jgi:MFS transporter, PAT family, solute carrier family 33 (acetyl-CoA transportor), member 1
VGLISFPLLIVNLLTPLLISQTQRPLLWFARAYIPRILVGIVLATYLFFIPHIRNEFFFFPILIILLCLNEGFNSFHLTARVGFYAQVSEPRIAGTYMTFLGTVSNMGQRLSSTIVLYIAEWLPKSEAYSIEVGACCLVGIVWMCIHWSIMRHLHQLPIEQWHLQSESSSSSNATATRSQDTIATITT